MTATSLPREASRPDFNPWWPVLFYTLVVILFGAVVRITGSGAGCGQHWPTCHGEIAHLPRSVETTIELTHRVTSGLSLLLVVLAYAWTRQRTRGRELVRRGAFWAVLFMIVEALVGAALVLLELVGTDDSAARAVVMAVHLINTSLLMLSLLVAAWAWPRPGIGLSLGAPDSRFALVGAFVILVVSAAGAVTALGDTLFPVVDHAQVAREAAAGGSHFLERLRGVHPILATLGAVYLLWAVGTQRTSWFAAAVPWLVVVQVFAGLLNVWLSAPGWMQVLHLALANLLWLAWCGSWLETAAQGRQPQATPTDRRFSADVQL